MNPVSSSSNALQQVISTVEKFEQQFQKGTLSKEECTQFCSFLNQASTQSSDKETQNKIIFALQKLQNNLGQNSAVTNTARANLPVPQIRQAIDICLKRFQQKDATTVGRRQENPLR